MRGIRPNIAKIKKSELIKMSRWRCEHGETGLSHYRCWLRHNPNTERVGFLDIETSNLKADFGIILTYAIKPQNVERIYQRTITKSDLRSCLDENVVAQCIKDLRNFDRIVTWYGSRFDVKFLRSRALALGLDFPEYGELRHNDIYYVARNKLCLSSNRLDTVSRALFGNSNKTRIESDKWIRALTGSEADLEYIADHCRKDVEELERVYHTLVAYARQEDRSI